MDESDFTPPRNQILLPEFIDDFFFQNACSQHNTSHAAVYGTPRGESSSSWLEPLCSDE